MTMSQLPQTNGHYEANGTAAFDSIEDSIAALESGSFIIVLDSTDRENEGDLIMAAEHCTPEKMAFMIRYTSAYLCAPITAARAAELNLPLMVPSQYATDPLRTAYTITVDALGPDVSTGISASDRSLSARKLADPTATAASFRRPGHLVPLIARDGGVLVRQGHTEAAVDLCRLAGCAPAAVIGEMVLEGEPSVSAQGIPQLVGGGMMRRDDCLAFGKKFGLKVCTIEDLVKYLEAGKGKGKC